MHSINFQMSHIHRLKRPLTFSRSLRLLFSSSGVAAALLLTHPHFPYQVALEWEFMEDDIYSVHNSNYMERSRAFFCERIDSEPWLDSPFNDGKSNYVRPVEVVFIAPQSIVFSWGPVWLGGGELLGQHASSYAGTHKRALGHD